MSRNCSEPGCQNKARARGLCTTHYPRWRESAPDRPLCGEPGCGRTVHARGLCNNHYQRWFAVADERPRCSEPGCGSAMYARSLCRRHYSLSLDSDAERPACAEPGCDRKATTRGLCRTHYVRQWKKERATAERELLTKLEAAGLVTRVGASWQLNEQAVNALPWLSGHGVTA